MGSRRPGWNGCDFLWVRYGFSYVHLRVMALFYPYPNLGFAEDAPFMLKLREKTRRVGLMEDVEGLCLHKEKLSSLAVSDCTAYEDFMENFWESFSWMTNIFMSLFHFWWSCWSDLRTCRSDQLVSPLSDFTNFTISHQFHHVQNIEDCSLKVGKDTTAFEPGSWEWKVSCHVWTPKAVVGWSVRRDTLKDRSFFVKKHKEKDVVNRNQASGTMRPTSVASILIEFWQWKIDTYGAFGFQCAFFVWNFAGSPWKMGKSMACSIVNQLNRSQKLASWNQTCIWTTENEDTTSDHGNQMLNIMHFILSTWIA